MRRDRNLMNRPKYPKLLLYLEVFSKDHIVVRKTTFEAKKQYVADIIRDDISVPGSGDTIEESDEAFVHRARVEMHQQYYKIAELNNLIDATKARSIDSITEGEKDE